MQIILKALRPSRISANCALLPHTSALRTPQEMQVSMAKRNGEYDEGGIMKPSCGEISFVKETVSTP